MSQQPFEPNRRNFFKVGLGAAASLAFVNVLKLQDVFGAEAKKPAANPMLSEKDPIAVSLKYVADSKKADPKARTNPKSFCDNCTFYTAADKKSGACQIFQGKQVAAKGWCMTWNEKKTA